MFINNCPTTGITINSFRKAQGCMNEDVIGLVDDILAGRAGCCPLEGSKGALEDGSLWTGAEGEQEALEQLHALICEHEEMASIHFDDLETI